MTLIISINMPAAPRVPGKATKIAYKLLGKPANMQKDSKRDQLIDRRLLYEETMRVR